MAHDDLKWLPPGRTQLVQTAADIALHTEHDEPIAALEAHDQLSEILDDYFRWRLYHAPAGFTETNRRDFIARST